MTSLLVAVLIVLAVVLLVSAVVAALATRAIVRANRVDPRVRSTAPLSWLASPAQAARLHRRLRAAAGTARAAAVPMPGAAGGADVSDLAADLNEEAIVLDQHVVHAARMAMRRVRHQQLKGIERDVARVEAAAARMAAAARTPRASGIAGAGPVRPIDERVGERLDLLEEALREVTAIEQHATGALPLPEMPVARPSSTETA